ncbi:hypothetical protein [Brucella pseudintermedia]|uniref:hypothetical protein n=1 Tax=Brucella pseudintermedia TaxID=370111 RepID=UPI00124E6098|nr:hypothetical protein [Brucella pseudintermedia]KAB2679728.1 hypothetical protein F9K78_19050 [Brucella pseudintermedia]
MSDFEIRYNAGELAHFALHQQIMKELALLKGEQAESWLEKFTRSANQNAANVRLQDGSQQNAAITETAQSIISALSQAVAHQLK